MNFKDAREQKLDKYKNLWLVNIYGIQIIDMFDVWGVLKSKLSVMNLLAKSHVLWTVLVGIMSVLLFKIGSGLKNVLIRSANDAKDGIIVSTH